MDRIQRSLALLGHPEEAFAAVLVAGTNGKGSVCALVESALRAAGLRTGLYTSPHLVDVRERVRVRGRMVSRPRWRSLLGGVARAVRRAGLSPTEFEAQTLAAFRHFADEKVEIAVVEVGLGGRLDATNALPAPEATVITSIGHDHRDWLGNTLRQIYREKRGIARPGTRLIQNLPAGLWAEAKRFEENDAVPSWFLGRDIRLHAGRAFRVDVAGKSHGPFALPLAGDHQRENAALAVATLHELHRRGWPLTKGPMARGIKNASWPGRFQALKTNPPAILDGAHNLEAVRSLAAAWRQSRWKNVRPSLIFSCLKDKDLRAMVRVLRPLAGGVFVMPLAAARGRPVKELAGAWGKGARVCHNFPDAWRKARAGRRPVLVTGSLYLVGEALKFFRRSPR